MANKLYKEILLIVGLGTVIFEANAAATATTTVTANIVPASSFSISENFHQNIIPEEKSDVLRSPVNNNRIEISSFDNKNTVKVKIISYHNNTYNLSIASQSILTGPDASNRIKIDKLEVDDSSPSLNSNNEQGLIIEGVLTIPGSNYTGSYSGTTEITVNYN